MAAARVLIAGAEGAAAPTAAPFGLSMFDAVKQSADLLRNVSTPPAAPVAVAVAATSNDDFDVDDEAIVYRGRTGGVLWFGPTTETTGGPSRDDLAAESIELVEDQPRFDTSTEAQQFVASLGTEGDEPEAPAEPEVESEPPTTQVASDAATRSTERSTITSSPPGTTEAP